MSSWSQRVDKTFGKINCKSNKQEIYRISLGGIRDEAEIRGPEELILISARKNNSNDEKSWF